MDHSSLKNALQELAFAETFSADVLSKLAACASLKRVPAGTLLFREGEHHDAFYLVQQGHVALEMRRPAQSSTRLLTLAPGEVLAWSALVGEGQMTATAIAQDDVALIEFPGAALRIACDADPVFGYALMRRLAASLAKRLLATRLQMVDLFAADAPRGGNPA